MLTKAIWGSNIRRPANRSKIESARIQWIKGRNKLLIQYAHIE